MNIDFKHLGLSRILSAAIVAAIIILAIGVTYTLTKPGTLSSTTVSKASSTSASSTNHSGLAATSQTTTSTLGLKLSLSINSTTIPSEEAINISDLILNTLPTANNLTASNDWAIQGLSGVCDLGNSTNKLFSPIGVAVFRGYYGINNLSSASALPIWAEIECPANFAFNGTSVVGNLLQITNYTLLPGEGNGSYSAYYYSSQAATTLEGTFPTEMIYNAVIYANNGTGFRPYNSLLSSLPYTYTIAAGDEWGQLVVLHFNVISSSTLPTVGDFLASSGACGEDGNPVPCFTSEFSQAFVFVCVGAAAASSGCTQHVSSGLGNQGSPLTNYTITVWYPSVNQTDEPAWANCKFSVKGDTALPYGYCFLVNSTAFVLSEGGPSQP